MNTVNRWLDDSVARLGGLGWLMDAGWLMDGDWLVLDGRSIVQPVSKTLRSGEIGGLDNASNVSIRCELLINGLTMYTIWCECRIDKLIENSQISR